jgi:hypothetical protein
MSGRVDTRVGEQAHASIATQQHPGSDLLLGGAWIMVLAVGVVVVLRRAISALPVPSARCCGRLFARRTWMANLVHR